MKKPLLEFTSVTYLRRLAKELNSLPDGFYFEGVRYNRASCSTLEGTYGKIPYSFRISRPGEESNHTESRSLGSECYDKFFDAYGRNVCAARHQK